jgi:DMSO/TMAO reductase YedYZ molybdopterin-dependent catalytic subunit
LPDPNAKSAPPIGGGRKGEFRYYTVTEVPKLNNQNWSLAVDGLVDRKKTYNWGQFVQVQRDVQVSDFHCVTGWSVYNCTWEGIPLKKLLSEAGVKKGAKYVKFYSADGVYTDTLTIKQAMMNDVMVAMLIDGQLIDQQNGGPVRLIIPKMYAYKSVKWLNRIELIADEHTGYWEERGYSKNAWVKGI